MTNPTNVSKIANSRRPHTVGQASRLTPKDTRSQARRPRHNVGQASRLTPKDTRSQARRPRHTVGQASRLTPKDTRSQASGLEPTPRKARRPRHNVGQASRLTPNNTLPNCLCIVHSSASRRGFHLRVLGGQSLSNLPQNQTTK